MPQSSHFLYTYCSPVAGVLLALAFAPFECAIFAVLALGFLFFSWEGVSPRKAALRGYLFGLGLFGFGISWVYISIHDFGGAGFIGAGLMTVFFVGFWAIFPALVGYWVAKVKWANLNLSTITIAPLLWILGENIRGYWLLNGFPWLQIAYSQMDMPLAGYIPILGVYGTGFLLAISASAIVYSLQNKRKHRLTIICLVCCLWLVGGVLKTIQWTHDIGKEIKVSLVQGNVPQDQKWLPENRMNTLMKYKQLTQEHWDSQVIIWPEASIPAYLSDVDDYYIKPLEAEAKQHNVDLIVSLPMQDAMSDAVYNGVLALGKLRGEYKKNHLLPFGEYLPLQPVSGFVLKLLGIRLGSFTVGGDSQELLKAGGYAFSTSICYEDAFGTEVIRNVAHAAFLVNVTNDAWFGDSIEPHQHMQIARMRALESGRYLLRATNTGLTGVVGPNGKIIKQAPLFETAVLTGYFKPMAGMTPYAHIGDMFIIMFLVVLLTVILVINRIYLKR